MTSVTRRRIGIAILLTALAVLALAFLAPFLVDKAYYEGLIVTQLERRLGREVSVSSVGIRLFPLPALELRGVSIAEPPPEAEAPFLTMSSLRVSARLRPLLQGQFVPYRVVIDEPRMHLTREKNGTLNIADLLGQNEDEQPARTASGGSSDATGVFTGPRVRLVDGHLLFADHGAVGGRLDTEIDELAIDVEPRDGGLGPRFSVAFHVRSQEHSGRVEIDGAVGAAPQRARVEDLPVELRLRAEALDLRAFVRHLPAPWQDRIPRAVATADLSLDGRPAGDLAVSGQVQLEDTQFDSDSLRVRGTVQIETDGSRHAGVVQGKSKITLAPGTFTREDDVVIEGRATLDADIRSVNGKPHAQVRIDASGAGFRLGNVFAKKADTGLVLEASLAQDDKGISIRDVSGNLGEIAIAGSAEIDLSAGPGRPTPFGLHFRPTTIDLADVSEYLDAVRPFMPEGRVHVNNLDILHRPGAGREWQVAADAKLADASLKLPTGSAAHGIDALSTQVHVEPGLLTLADARARINGVPLSFAAAAREFTALFSGDTATGRSAIEFAATGKDLDLERLITPSTESGKATVPAERGQPAQRPRKKGERDASGTHESVRRPEPSRPFLDRFTIARGTLDAERAEYRGQPLEKLHLRLTYEPPLLRVRDTTFRLHGGRGTFEGTVNLDGGPAFGLEMTAADVQLEKLMASVAGSGASKMRGSLRSAIKLRARGGSPAEWKSTLSGSGEIKVREGTMPGFNLFETLTRAVLGGLSAVVPRTDELSLAGSNSFHLFEHDFLLDEAGVHADKVTLVTDDYELAGKGDISLDGKINYDARVALTATGTQKFLTMASLPVPGSSSVKLPAIPLRVTGTLNAPKITPDVSGISVGMLRGLVDVPQRAVQEGARAVGKEVLKLFGGGKRDQVGADRRGKPAAP